MSKKILKVVVTIMMMLLAIIIVQTKAEARRLDFGVPTVVGSLRRDATSADTVVEGLPGNETFCIQNGRYLNPHTVFNIQYYVHIDKNTSYIYRGNSNSPSSLLATHEDTANGTMAYILAQYDSGSWVGNYSPKQQAVYGHIGTWLNANVIRDVGYNSGGHSYPSMIKQGEQYAQSVQQEQKATITIKSEAQPTIELVEINGQELAKVGPFTPQFDGTLEYVRTYDQNNNEIAPLYGSYEGDNLITSSNALDILKNEKQFFVLVPADGTVEKINKIDVGIYKDSQDIKADIWILGTGGQNLITVDTQPTPLRDNANAEVPEITLLGDLKLEKVNKNNHDFKLDGVTFVFTNARGKYVKQEGDKISYVDSREEATEFTTDDKGQIEIKDLIVGTYTAHEVGNKHYGYIAPENGTDVKVIIDGDYQVVENEQKWIKLSGYVWKDMIFGKDTQRNDLFQDNTYDKNDELMPGVTVRLKSKSTGEVIGEQKTDENGAYLFEDVEIEKLNDYYIEFEYDGLIYTNVIPHIDIDNGSKAAENEITRQSFNDEFTYVEGNDKEKNTGVSIFKDGESRINELKYNKGEGDDRYKSFFDYENQYFPLTANTDETGYSIESHFTYGEVEEIKNINLGLYLRDRPDLAIKKDVQNAIVSINRYNHTYNYANRYENQGEYENGFNVGVKFPTGTTNPDKAKYTRPIYKADALYTDDSAQQSEGENNKELKVAVTYRIRYRNESTTLGARVNRIVDYYDANYTIQAIGTGIDEKGNVTGELKYQENENYNDKYKMVTINTLDTILEPGKSSAPSSEEEEKQVEEDKLNGEYQGVKDNTGELKGDYQGSDVYIQFIMNRDTVKTILDMNENDENEPEAPLENVVEIASYTSFDSEGNVYAGIDIDSAPGNVTPDNLETYEDDTDAAPSFILQYHGDGDGRTLEGNVFEDLAEAPNNGGTGNQKLGNGIFDGGEHGIGNVQVQLLEVETTENGDIERDSEGNPTIKKDESNNPKLAQRFDNLGNEITTETITSNDDGTYSINGFVPGKYVIRFIWGDGSQTYTLADGTVITYTSENYKSTTQPEDEWNRKMTNPEWYKKYLENPENPDQVDPRYTDAKDDPSIRAEIDEITKHQVYENSVNTANMNMESTTAPMSITIEFDELEVTEVEFDQDGNSVKDVFLKYNVPRVDFGIIERPIQDLKLSKRVSGLRLTFANGQVLVDATIAEDGTITGQRDSLTYMPQSNTAPFGTVKLELDNEVMQGATLQVQYEFKATNISEKDYDSTRYYDYGVIDPGAQLRTLSAEEIVDYLDNSWGYDETINSDWQQKDAGWVTSATEELHTTHKNMFADEVKADTTKLDAKRILTTTALSKPLTPEAPNNVNTTNLTVSKVLAASDEDINLNNETEIIHIDKEKGGRKVSSTPGNYVPGKALEEGQIDEGENDTSVSEEVKVTSPTGQDAITYVIYTAVTIVALIVLGSGIVLIKKKVLTK